MCAYRLGIRGNLGDWYSKVRGVGGGSVTPTWVFSRGRGRSTHYIWPLSVWIESIVNVEDVELTFLSQ